MAPLFVCHSSIIITIMLDSAVVVAINFVPTVVVGTMTCEQPAALLLFDAAVVSAIPCVPLCANSIIISIRCNKKGATSKGT
jgi:hypothetical protein